MGPPACAWVAPAGPALVVVPRYAPGVPTRLTPLSGTEAFLSPALHAVNLLPHGIAGAGALGRLVAQSPCYALTMSDLDEACALVLGLVEATAPMTPGAGRGRGRPGAACGAAWCSARRSDRRSDRRGDWRRPDRRAGRQRGRYDDVGQLLILLNTSAASVWERCDGTTTLDEMARQPCRRRTRTTRPTSARTLP